MKLRTFFAISIAGLVFILSAILSAAISYISSDKIKQQAGASLSEVSFQMANNLDYFMWSRFSELNVLSELESIKEDGNEERIQKLINELSVNIPSFSWVGLTNKDGVVIASTREILKNTNISKRPVFQEAKEETFIGDVHDAVLLSELLPNPTGEPLQFVDISTPIEDKQGNFKGVLAAHLSWEWTQEIKKNVFSPLEGKRKDIEVFIVSSKHNTVLLGPKNMVGKPLNLESVQDAKKQEYGWNLEEWSDGKKYVTGYAYGKGYSNYPGLGWTVIVRQPEDAAYFSLKELQKKILLVGICIAVVFAVVGRFLAGIIVKPLNRISEAAQALKKGERVEIPVIKGIKDIEILSSSLRELIENLTKTEVQLGVMETLAHHDALTNLPNRMALDTYMKNEVTASSKQFLFLFMDLDGFKNVNDTLGHGCGDLLLQEVAKRVKHTIGEGDFLSRMGGDEFVVISPVKPEVEDPMQLGNEIIKSINEPITLQGHVVFVGCSIGASIWTNEEQSPEEVLQLADQALYESKRTGKNKIMFL